MQCDQIWHTWQRREHANGAGIATPVPQADTCHAASATLHRLLRREVDTVQRVILPVHGLAALSIPASQEETMKSRTLEPLPTLGALLTLLAPVALAEEIPFDSERWEIKADEFRIESHLDRQSLFLSGGVATVRDVEFLDGVLEFDIAFTGERGFMGGIWRLQEGNNGEEFYLRPHQTGKPDANQYTPILNGVTSWQLYHGEGYGAPVEYVYDEWMPVRIVVSGERAEVYIRDLETPAVVIGKQKRTPGSGRVGLNAFFAPAHFSRFRVTLADGPRLQGTPPAAPVAPEGTILSWSVSDSFDEKALAGLVELPAEEFSKLRWQPLATEEGGLANLAHVHGLGENANTVFARATLTSEGSQVRQLHFGYSDRVRVYLNGRLLYTGDNTYRTRDFRYLGTIGYFDSVPLPLHAGENELWMAVSESFGGWGVQAYVESTPGSG